MKTAPPSHFCDELKEMLKTATSETMDKLEAAHPFENDESFTVFLLAHIITGPQALVKAFGISKPAANHVCAKFVAALVVPSFREEEK